MKQWQHLEPDLVLYVRCPPQTALDRLTLRGGPEQGHCSLGYLRRLDELHEEWLKGQSNVLRVNTGEPVDIGVLAANIALKLDLNLPLTRAV